MPVKSALAALLTFVTVQSSALVVWPSFPAPFFATLTPACEWKAHSQLFLSVICESASEMTLLVESFRSTTRKVTRTNNSLREPFYQVISTEAFI